MMAGAFGALACLLAGTALGSLMRDRRQRRFGMLEAQMDMIGSMRLLLRQERPGMAELLTGCAAYAADDEGAQAAKKRFCRAAELLEKQPLLGLGDAYQQACEELPAPWEHEEERAAVGTLFLQLGSGTADMREQAAATCLRRLKPLAEHARTQAQNGGKLCMQMGMLLGLMAGIVLW